MTKIIFDVFEQYQSCFLGFPNRKIF